MSPFEVESALLEWEFRFSLNIMFSWFSKLRRRELLSLRLPALPISRPISGANYQDKMEKEIMRYRTVENVHDLPDIFHYWSNKHLLPKFQQLGFRDAKSFFLLYMKCVAQEQPGHSLRFISIGAGNCDTEAALAEQLLLMGMRDFSLECLDVNSYMLDRGRALAQEKKLIPFLRFTQSDVNHWHPSLPYHIVLANQSLHHFVELETMFDKIYQTMDGAGYFLADDMIGRNGHMRWPEALSLLQELWRELPDAKKYNYLLKRVEIEYDNWDCSKDSFEGIRAQDVLPLLTSRFGFDLFIAFGNVIDVFVDRCFGHNFNPHDSDDVAFIDKVHRIDELNIERGAIKPTHMTAAMVKDKNRSPKCYKHLTPEFCLRRPDNEPQMAKKY